VFATACGAKQSAQPAATTASTATTTTAPTTTSTTVVPTTTTVTTPASTDVVLFPFANLGEVAAWQASYRNGGQQPWHLDANETALAFARFLGYTSITKAVWQRTDAAGAHVAVGFATEGTGTATAAVVHLVRYGSGADVPWEVVGTDDDELAITTPVHGATVTSPLSVGGRISGVDESIKVRVVQLHANGSLGTFCCVPAGGMGSPWHATVAFAHPTDPVLIVSASTGGHLQSVERFSVTGVRAG
jgi:hypothetical protein